MKFKTYSPQLLPTKRLSKAQNRLTKSMTINKMCQLPILVQKRCPKTQLIILDNTSRLCAVLCSETQFLMKILRRSDWVNLYIGNLMFKAQAIKNIDKATAKAHSGFERHCSKYL